MSDLDLSGRERPTDAAVARCRKLDSAPHGLNVNVVSFDDVSDLERGEDVGMRVVALRTEAFDVVSRDYLALLAQDRDDVHGGAPGKGNQYELRGARPEIAVGVVHDETVAASGFRYEARSVAIQCHDRRPLGHGKRLPH